MKSHRVPDAEGGLIAAAVVDDYNFEWNPIMDQGFDQCRNGLLNRAFFVAGGDNDRKLHIAINSVRRRANGRRACGAPRSRPKFSAGRTAFAISGNRAVVYSGPRYNRCDLQRG